MDKNQEFKKLEWIKPYQSHDRMDYRHSYTEAGKYHMRNENMFPIQTHGDPQTTGDQNQRYKHRPQ